MRTATCAIIYTPMKYRAIMLGVIGGGALLALYFAVLTLISGWPFARIQFARDWYWIAALALGFGIQVFLFSFARALHRVIALGVTGTTSGAAMLACCTHYLANILPFIGVSGLVAFVGQYQTGLFAVGVIFNIAGIAYLSNKLRIIYGHQN